MSTIEERLRALEAAVARLQGDAAADLEGERAVLGASPTGDADSDRFWILERLRLDHPGGAVAFAGHAPLADRETQWQWGRLTDDLLDDDWPEAASPLAALGHPVRLRLLQLVLAGTTTTSDLAEAEGLGTTGQLHHHLRTLVNAGWLASVGRGRYHVPPQRVVPLLVVVSATL
ncbi:helix-turn-helix domain-containing protein [Mobilicoccus massiliensis]|uniref:helix-turn-helix domain-containing protein n=1 Tax=Mobilicoccus massiliensis TaxID=1522310 RepID=UPI00058B3B4D|nr:helix-turn-helix domain-containing protein [Mobilicoccus massiliensis]